MADAYNLTTLLAQTQRVPCSLLLPFAQLTSPTSLPLFQARELVDFLDILLPDAFDIPVQSQVKASPTATPLGSLCPYYYDVGLELGVNGHLLKCLMGRVSLIWKSAVSRTEWVDGDEFEGELYKSGKKSCGKVLEWVEMRKGMRASSVAERKRKRNE